MPKKKLDAVDIAAQQRAREQVEVEQAFLKGITTLRDLVAPSSLEIHASYFRLAQEFLPDSAAVLHGLATALANQGRLEEAVQGYRRRSCWRCDS